MKRIIAAALSMVFALGAAQAAEPVSFPAGDGGSVYGDVTPAPGAAKATILLFHQAGSNRGEYTEIAPRLAALGYNVLAIDQRAGGSMWGHTNQTAAARGSAAGYLDALPDLEGTLTYATRTWPGAPVILWGSSYSASLVFLLAARHPDVVTAVLSFSPGEYLPGVSVRDQAAKLRCPVFVTSASSADEVAAAQRLVDAVPGTGNVHFIARHATHGASALRTDANPAGAAEIWTAVEAFLSRLPAATPSRG